MRIIAGALKGRRLAAPAGRGVRPTSDMARGALFSILRRWPVGSFLDLFSGTGAVALEALSRGYSPVWCVESHRDALAAIRANASGAAMHRACRPKHLTQTPQVALGILAKDAMDLEEGDFSDVSVIFADPPYEAAQRIWGALAGRLRGFLSPGGVIVLECPRAAADTASQASLAADTASQAFLADLPPAPGLAAVDERRYGRTRFVFFEKTPGPL